MCGIAGLFSYRAGGPPVRRDELLAVRDHMAARGPDGAGEWISLDGRAALAHRRLAIIDVSERGAQPMASADGRFVITFNGEIYNYRQLRRELEDGGRRFSSTSDTEVLLHLYEERGPGMVHALRGMFAFAIWDGRERTLFLARDAFGIKPLYYADDGRTFRFASQVKALMAGGAIDAAPEPAAHVGFFVMGSVPEPYTMYRAVRALPAGSTLVRRLDAPPIIQRYFDLPAEFAAARQAPVAAARDRAAYLREALRDTVRHHMVADVPVGLFLSSGLDSSTIAALACEVHGNDLRSVTLGFDEYRGTPNDETVLAAATAGHLETAHKTRFVTRSTFDQELDRLVHAMDQPSIDGVNTYFVSQTAAEAGMKVALSGIGGDELFGGYPSFRDVPRLARLLRPAAAFPALGRAARRLSGPLLGLLASPKLASVPEYGGTLCGAYLLRRALYMPWEVEGFLDPATYREGWAELDLVNRLNADTLGIGNPRQAVSSLEMSWYLRNQLLRDADWAGMAHSLEIRVPFVDVSLFRRIAPLMALPSAPSKIDAARTPAVPLPAGLLNRRKTGFSIPVHEWATDRRRARGPQRRFRNWAHLVHAPYKKLRILALLPDAFGGHGGIALYNRDLLTSLCAMPECAEVVALPRLISRPLEALPAKLEYRREAANGKWRYLTSLWKLLKSDTRYDLVLCCHINLLPLAWIAKRRMRTPLMMFIYGIDAWSPQAAWRNRLLRHVDRFVSISDVTRRKFQLWSRIEDDKIAILPNAIHSDWYGPGSRNSELVARYRLEDKVVLMTLGRLVSSERYKGFDEVMEALPALLQEIPNLTYLIAGDGSDRTRLEEKAERLGVAAHVRFTGMISEAEKPDHYRLADAFVMPSRGEGFGFVLLEAMACGVPAVASSVDGGREAIRDGQLGVLVDPDNLEDVTRGILEALRRGRGAVPRGLEFFDFPHFKERTQRLVTQAVNPAIDGRPA